MIDMEELDDLEDARANHASTPATEPRISGGYCAPVDIRASAPVVPSSMTFTAPDPKLVRCAPMSRHRSLPAQAAPAQGCIWTSGR